MILKKVFTVLAALSLLLGATACTVREKKTDTVATEASETSSHMNQNYGSYGIGETARDGDIEMSVDSVEVVIWEQVDWSGAVYETHNLIKAHVSITNLGDEDLDLQPKDVRGFIDNEQLSSTQVDAAYESLGIKGDLIESATIHSGRSETGYILYEYYRDWTTFEIQYKDTSLDFELDFVAEDVITESVTIIPGENGETNVTDISQVEPAESTAESSGAGLTIPGVETTPTETASAEPTETTGTGLTIPTAG